MRKILYLSLFLSLLVNLSAQTPGGVAGSVLWLKADAGASPSLWTDNSTSANNFSQGTTANQPVLNGNVFNYNPALTFSGAQFLAQLTPASFPTGNADRSVFVVANSSSTSGYSWILVYGNVGSLSGTFQVGNNSATATAGLATAFYGTDVTSNNYWNAAANSNGALATSTMNSNLVSIYDRGSLLTSQTIGGLGASSINGRIGSIDGFGEFWNGNIAEIVLFPSALSTADQNKVESYLATKYGFTLGTTAAPQSYTASDGATVYWTANATYQNDVYGVGTDGGSGLAQQFSNSMNSGGGDGVGQSGKGNTGLVLFTPLSDNQFLMIGNDAGALTEQTIATGEAPTIAVGSQRVARNWKVQNTGGVGTIDALTFDITGLTLTGGATANNYRLMIDEDGDGDYNTGTQTFVAPNAVITSNQLSFENITLANNAVFTVITQGTAALLPALWKDFTVNLQNNKATLTWTTSNETDVDYYTVEYSLDGSSYTALTNIAAKNTDGTNIYTFAQDNLPAGARYYRIRRVDKNRSYSLSRFLKIQVGGVISKLALNTNPITRNRIDYTVHVTQNQAVVIRVVDMSGRILALQNKNLSAGTNSISTELPNIKTGMYYLQVRMANETITKKFIKQ